MFRSPSWPLIPVVVALVSVAVAFSSLPKPHRQVAAATVEWHEDLDAAIQIAKRTGKDVLVNFTAQRNCHACGLLKRQVLIQPEFLAYVHPHFVLVEIDKSMLETTRQEPPSCAGWRLGSFNIERAACRPCSCSIHRGGLTASLIIETAGQSSLWSFLRSAEPFDNRETNS